MGMAIKRGAIVLIGLVLQILLFLFVDLFLIEHITIISIFYGILGFLLVLGLIKQSKNYSYTLPWIIILIMFPLIGTLLYVILGKNKNNSKILKSITKSEAESKKYLIQNEKIKNEFKNNGRLIYLSDYTGYPVTKNNDVTYYPLGEKAFEVMLEELKKAEKFIFFEYFIVAHGKMWDSILEILEEKVKQGVDVRVMYDVFQH